MERGGYRGRGRGGRGGGGGRDSGRGGGRDGGRGGGRDGGRGGGRDGGRGNRGRGYQQHQEHQDRRYVDQSLQRPYQSQGQWGSSSGQSSSWAPRPQPQPQLQPQSSAAGVGRGAWVQRPQISSGSAAEQIISGSVSREVQVQPRPSAEVASSSSLKGNLDKKEPIRRPDKGGVVACRTINIRVNHFPVNFNPQSVIGHYNVDIKPDGPSKNGREAKISKSELSMIREKLCMDNPDKFPLSMTGYDGEKNLYSAVPLPTGTFKVEFPEGEDTKCRSYVFTISLVNQLRLCKLKDYITASSSAIPRDILQGMDVVMKEHPSRHMITVGRSFFSRATEPHEDTAYGFVASKGYRHTLKPTAQGLVLCMDYSVLAFRKRMYVIDYLMEFIEGFDLRQFRRFRQPVEEALTKLKVTVTHRKCKQKLTIVGLSKLNTRDITFDLQDPEGKEAPRRTSLVEYFRSKYGKDIVHKDIPCLDLGKNNRQNLVPMEFCILVEGQIYPKEDMDRESALWLKRLSLVKPGQRQQNIGKMIQSQDGPSSGDVIRNFGLEVKKSMTQVRGRVLEAPTLKLSDKGKAVGMKPDPKQNQWNLMRQGVTRGIQVQCWGVLDFSASERYDNKRLPENFIGQLMERCWRLGIQMEEPMLNRTAHMGLFSDGDKLEGLLRRITDEVNGQGRARLQLLLCVMSETHHGYKTLKWIAETKLGLVTQCCLSGSAFRGGDQYRANLALKINAKLGGSNVELMNPFPFFKGDDQVMFIGADVNHPAARNKTSPSIVAVVGTLNWPGANRYAARVHSQVHRKEEIQGFGEICLELVETHKQQNGKRPNKIVIFRDGVSEGQFDMVLNVELLDLKLRFEKLGYYPTITLIVAQKRHQTRFFPDSAADGGSTGNVPSGTVVDTKIIHPFEFDFYICSHHGGMGTSKPTHYYVLWDEVGYSSDQLQKLIFDMSFTFSRCTKPVSLVPPVFYADLVAYRGRMYHEATMEERHSRLHRSRGASSSRLAASFASMSLEEEASLGEKFYKLHADLKDVMFFV